MSQAQTVQGPVEAEEPGLTLVHEPREAGAMDDDSFDTVFVENPKRRLTA